MGNQAKIRKSSTVIPTPARNFPNRLGIDTFVYPGSAELEAIPHWWAGFRTSAAIANAEQLVHKRYQGRHLLIVDDVPVNLEVPQLFLEDSGLLVDTAEDGV